MIKFVVGVLAFGMSLSKVYGQEVEQPQIIEKICVSPAVNMRGVCVNPVPVADRDYTAASEFDRPLTQSSIEFLERLRK